MVVDDKNNTSVSKNITIYKDLKSVHYYTDPDLIKSNNQFSDLAWIDQSIKTITIKLANVISVFDVSAYILKKLGPISTMKLQKLVYYCQAWSLVWDESPLYNENIEAWANGPVVRDLFTFHKGIFIISSMPIGNPDCLNDKQKETVNAVLDFYGNKSAQWLIEVSHSEKPWQVTRIGMNDFERGNKVIPLDVIADYYSSLISQNTDGEK